MAIPKYDPRTAQKVEMEYQEQVRLLTAEVSHLETRMEQIPRELKTLKDEEVKLKAEMLQNAQKARELETELSKARSELGGKRRELEQVNQRNQDHIREMQKFQEEMRKAANDNSKSRRAA